MTAAVTVEMRPRTTGEVLDDAWHLALADAPLLLILSGLFLVPAFCVVLWLVTRPSPDGLLWPALGAALLLLTGLGSGSCQELLRLRAAGEGVSLTRCLRSALVNGLGHVSARALVLATTLPGPVWAAYALTQPSSDTPPLIVVLAYVGLGALCLVGLGFWIFAAPVHILVAEGKERSTSVLAELGSAARFALAKATLVVGSRVPLLCLAVFNLHLLLAVSLWAAENLGGLDTARLQVEMNLTQNPPYLLALLLLCWLLLAPFFEAGNFLLHLDARTRQEGLDLFYRVQRAFPLRERLPGSPRRGKGAGVALVLALVLYGGRASASAPDEAGAQAPLSKEEIKKLLGRHTGGRTPTSGRTQKLPRPRKEPQREEPRKDPEERPGVRPSRPVSGGSGGIDLGPAGWFLLGGLALGLLVAAGYQLWMNWQPRPPRKTTTGTTPQATEAPLPQPHEVGATELWRRADALARTGRFLDAVRAVYLAILAALHRQALIRFEPMRTNGEYVQQLRRAEAPAELADSFQHLTGAFEMRWYGEKSCSAEEYAQCRQLAEEVHSLTGAAS